MKAVLVLVALYIVTFLVAVQGASQSQAAQNPPSEDTAAQPKAKSIDAAKDADIRALMELIGAHDQVQEGVDISTEQYREKLLATVPNNEKGQAFVNIFAVTYQKKFDTDAMTEQVVAIYDKHYSDEEIRGLLQFFGSPLGQKVAAEMPKINREIAAASRGEGAKASHEALKAQNPEVGKSARFESGQRRWRSQQNPSPNSAQSSSTQQAQQADASQP